MKTETRSQTIARAINRYLHDTSDSMATYAITVVEVAVTCTSPKNRTVHWHLGGDPVRDAMANGQIIRRWLDPEIDARMPVEAEEWLVMALPESYRAELLAELAGRYNLLAVPVPEGAGTPGCDLSAMGAVNGSYAAIMNVAARMLEDCVFDPGDAEYLPALEHAARRVMADVTAILERARAGVRGAEKVRVVK